MVFARIEVRTGTAPAHSGVYGGAALNAFHALHAALSAVLAGLDGRLPEPLWAGVADPSPDELESWASLPGGDVLMRAGGAIPADARAVEEFHVRTSARPSLDVHRVSGGQDRTIVTEAASAALSVRLAPGQRSAEIAPALEKLLRDALPAGATMTFTAERCSIPGCRRSLPRGGRWSGPAGDRQRWCARAGRCPCWRRSPSGASRRSSPASPCRPMASTRRTSPTGWPGSSRARRLPAPCMRSWAA